MREATLPVPPRRRIAPLGDDMMARLSGFGVGSSEWLVEPSDFESSFGTSVLCPGVYIYFESTSDSCLSKVLPGHSQLFISTIGFMQPRGHKPRPTCSGGVASALSVQWHHSIVEKSSQSLRLVPSFVFT